MGNKNKADQVHVLSSLLQVINQYPGGAKALFAQFQQGGLGAVLSSWLNPSAQRMAVQPDQLKSALGDSVVNEVAEQSGVDQQSVLQHLSTLLPMVVGSLAEKGVVSENNIPEKLDSSAVISAVLGMLKK